jgi:hypothetical protein
MMGPFTPFSIPANINSLSTSTSESFSLSGIRLNTGPRAEECIQVISIYTRTLFGDFLGMKIRFATTLEGDLICISDVFDPLHNLKYFFLI